MSLKREDMLRELELLPVWRERKPHQEQAGESAEKDAPASAAAPKPAPAPATMIEPISEADSTIELPSEQAVRASPEQSASTHKSPAQEPQLPVEELPPADPEALQAPIRAEDVDVPSAEGSPMGDDRREIIMRMDWPALQEAVAHCPACNLCKTRTKTVFGVGDIHADWLLVGEAPGAEEDRKGEPFVGQAGRLLDNMLAAIQLKRGDNVYIANVLKCRPPDNRDPQGEEVYQCDPYLKRQVELIQPKLIVALGKFAAQSLLNSKDSIAAMRGKQHDYHGVPVIVTYHPAYLLRSMAEKAKAWEDLCYARDTMQALQSAAEAP
jgi:uracil-DNA glycosylase family 4